MKRSVCQASISSVIPLNVLPSITKPPDAGSRAPRWMLESQPWRRPLPHSTASTTRSRVCTGLTLTHADAAAAGVVRRGEVLHHDALVAVGEHLPGELLGGGGVVGDQPGHDVGLGHQGREPGEAFGAGGVEQVVAVEVQEVEEVRRHRDPGVLGGPGRGLLERPRPAGVVERERLAVEDQPPGRQRPDHLDHLGQPLGDVVEAPGGDQDVVAVAMDLDPDAVELDVHRDRRRRPPWPSPRPGRARWTRASAAPAGRPPDRPSPAPPRRRRRPRHDRRRCRRRASRRGARRAAAPRRPTATASWTRRRARPGGRRR